LKAPDRLFPQATLFLEKDALMKTNVKTPAYPAPKTHGGANAARISNYNTLRRSVLSCLLWEDEFYEDGKTIAERIADLVPSIEPEKVAALAVEARDQFNLRHVSLWLIKAMVAPPEHRKLVADTLEKVIRRADEPGEFLAMLGITNAPRSTTGWGTIPHQVKMGLARAMTRFDEYQLAKWNKDAVVKLKDVLFLTHAKPKDADQDALWKRLIAGTMKTPDTWEVALSDRGNNKEDWIRLLTEGKLDYMALMKNLRNMEKAEVPDQLIRDAILARKGAHKLFPFRFVSAAKHAKRFEPEIDQAFVAELQQRPKLKGKTVLIVDVSGSMYSAGNVSAKSDITRVTAACALAAIAREVCEDARIYATAGSDMSRTHQTEMVPARRGMALVDAIHSMSTPLGGGGIFLHQVMKFTMEKEKTADRVIVFTDEQDCSGAGMQPETAPMYADKNYMINVASHKNGIGYGKWTHIDGFSEAIMNYIYQSENIAANEQ
jgi:60 kDa SS-A/Ro ribonucleoprotein